MVSSRDSPDGTRDASSGRAAPQNVQHPGAPRRDELDEPDPDETSVRHPGTPAPPPPPQEPAPTPGERPCVEWVYFDRFITRQDERVCPICGPLHGGIHERGFGPHPPLHTNCRCQRVYSHRDCLRRGDTGDRFPRE